MKLGLMPSEWTYFLPHVGHGRMEPTVYVVGTYYERPDFREVIFALAPTRAVFLNECGEAVHTMTAPGESPFEEPGYECRDCGRSDEHTYCIRWMERLHLWFTRKRTIYVGDTNFEVRFVATAVSSEKYDPERPVLEVLQESIEDEL